jgi:hypothetical protein
LSIEKWKSSVIFIRKVVAMVQKMRFLTRVFFSKRIINNPIRFEYNNFCRFPYEDTGQSALEFSYGRVSYMSYEFYKACPIK